MIEIIRKENKIRNLLGNDYLDLFVKELIDKKKEVKSELLIDVFESLIKNYGDYEWRKL